MLFTLHARLRVRRHPAFPTPFSWKGGEFSHTSGAFAPRECGGVTDLLRRRCDKRKPFAHASAGECHSPCHRPRRRTIQYCRGADDQSTGRGVLDTRFRGYDGGPTTNASCLRMRALANVTRRVIAREGRSSIAEEPMINREAAAYWIPAFAGMTAGPATNANRLRMRAQRSDPASSFVLRLTMDCFAALAMTLPRATRVWVPASQRQH